MSTEGARRALEKFCAKQIKQSRPKRKNKQPEKELVQNELLPWLRSKGFFCNVVESKAVYSQAAGRYNQGQTVPGMPDIVGCDSQGLSVFVEAKAPGRLSTLREKQREFLTEVIQRGGFGVVVDSADRLQDLYNTFLNTPIQKRPEYLLSQLPKPKKSSEKTKKNWIDL